MLQMGFLKSLGCYEQECRTVHDNGLSSSEILSKLDLIIISFFLIQNKLSNEWSTILVVQIFQ